MRPQQYRKVYDWFTARPAALRALRLTGSQAAAMTAPLSTCREGKLLPCVSLGSSGTKPGC